MTGYVFCWSESSILPYDIHPEDLVIAADSGFEYAARCGIVPNIVLGDFDSMEESLVPDTLDKITLQREKDETDAMYGVRLAIDKGCDKVYIAGGLGGRLDHTLGALAVLRYAAEKCVATEIDDGYTSARIVKGGSRIEMKYDPAVKYVSVFPSADSVTLTIKGLKYPLSDYVLKSDDPICVSNEFLAGVDGSIYADNGDAIVITIKTP